MKDNFTLIGAEISQENLSQIWNQCFNDKPFPKVTALLQSKKQFIKSFQKLKKFLGIIDTSIIEWDEYAFPIGFIFPSSIGFIILGDDTYKDRLDELLEHELKYIYSEKTHL